MRDCDRVSQVRSHMYARVGQSFYRLLVLLQMDAPGVLIQVCKWYTGTLLLIPCVAIAVFCIAASC